MEYRSNATLADLARRIHAAEKTLITTHMKPDGDAIGSAVALARALAAKGKHADVFLMGPIQPNLRIIAEPTPFRLIDNEMPADDYDLVIVTDTGAWAQLEPLAPWLKQHHERIIGLDHHSRGEDVAAYRFIDPKAVSTTAVLVRLLDEMQCEITGGVGGIAEALFVGVATDSGWFRYENAGPEAFAVAARLLKCGVNKSRLYEILEETYGPQRLALEARALASLRYARRGTVAIQLLRQEDFDASGATLEDVTGLVNTPMTVSAVRMSILLTQTQPHLTKISFRSKPAFDASHEFFDVNELASQFGGGGHIHAAGARVKMNIDDALKTILAEIGE